MVRGELRDQKLPNRCSVHYLGEAYTKSPNFVTLTFKKIIIIILN